MIDGMSLLKCLRLFPANALALKTDGTIWGWGNNSDGQIGDGTTVEKTIPTQIGTNTNWREISCGLFHSFAIQTDGTLWAWGMNSNYQLGDDSSKTKTSPTQIGTNTNWSKVDGGYMFSIGIQTDGTLWSWGANGSGGTLGNNGTPAYGRIPTRIGTDTDWKNISCGDSHTIAQKNDNTIWAWGLNTNGQLGNGNTANQKQPVQVDTRTSGITAIAGGLFSMTLYKKSK